ncbi:hypothetical protein MTR67_052296 [Solanum verrucosum]|uniref:Uncharacterized protein n=1 Tax=Solanum verrucosum TaxID=315347 RepID=A0AAF0V8U6_SOLVR|nr:hypothetical protein MTR67_052296 [Solanum verrucosum]
MGCSFKKVNAVGTSYGFCSEEEKFEVMYNEEVQFLSNQGGGSCSIYQRSGKNQCWTKNREGGWRDKDWHD